MVRRRVVRRRGIGLLGATAIGGTAYAVGSSRAKNRAEMQHMQEEQKRLSMQQQQLATQQQQMALRPEGVATQPAQAPQPSAATGTTQEQKISQLKELAELQKSGVLTPDEFEREKKKILG